MINYQNKKIAVIGGGTGIFSVLSGLKEYPVDLSAIVSMADDGGSTGVLREEFGVLPPGDIRRALIALSDSEQTLCDLFNYRFQNGTLSGHNFGNLFITALSKMEKSFEQGLNQAATLLDVKGKVIPVTLDDGRLCAKLENNQIVKGETNIDIPKHDGNLKIEQVFLKPSCKINPNAKQAILKADLIVIGPGDLYTSVVPNLLVEGVPKAIRESKAKKVYICNLMTKFGETNNFAGSDFVEVIENYLAEEQPPSVLDYVVLNNQRPTKERVEQYEKEGAQFVNYNQENFSDSYNLIEGNFLRDSGLIRHHPHKTAQAILKICG